MPEPTDRRSTVKHLLAIRRVLDQASEVLRFVAEDPWPALEQEYVKLTGEAS